MTKAGRRGAARRPGPDASPHGASTTLDPEAPTYTLRDLAGEATAPTRELDDRPALKRAATAIPDPAAGAVAAAMLAL